MNSVSKQFVCNLKPDKCKLLYLATKGYFKTNNIFHYTDNILKLDLKLNFVANHSSYPNPNYYCQATTGVSGSTMLSEEDNFILKDERFCFSFFLSTPRYQ